jgi:hypothetical protein
MALLEHGAEVAHFDVEVDLGLNDRYLGATETFHQQALDIAPGVHVVTVVDEAGNRLSRRFEVLGESR